MPGHVVVSSYHRSAARAGRYVSYMVHREERLPDGQTRELHTVGERYRALEREAPTPRALEDAVRRQLVADGRGVKPVYHTPVFTVNDQAAAVLRAMPRDVAEQRLRAALRAALRSTAHGRRLEGAYVVQWHGGKDRPGHPHVHVILSPRNSAGRPTYLGQRHLDRMREAWGHELDRSLRLTRTRERHRTRARQPRREPRQPSPTRGPLDLLRVTGTVRRYVANPVRAAAGDAARATVRALVRAATTHAPTRALTAAAARGPRAAATHVATKVAGPLAVPATVALAIVRSAAALVRSAARGM